MAVVRVYWTLYIFVYAILPLYITAIKYNLLKDVVLVAVDENSMINEYPGVKSPRHCAKLCSANVLCVASNYDQNSNTCQLMADILTTTDARGKNTAIGEFTP